MKLKLATLAMTSALAFNANAVDTVSVAWGTHLPFEIANRTVLAAGSFEDFYSFSLTALANIFSTAVSINNSDGSVLPEGSVSLLHDLGPAGIDSLDAVVGNYAFSGLTGNIQHAFLSQGPGNYYYRVSGAAVGLNGDSYSLTSALAPVPEPQTYALMLAGLGVIGFLARRRRPQA